MPTPSAYLARLGTFAVLLHAAISFAHGYAHRELDVQLNQFQTVYVAIVITIAPLLAAILLWTRFARLGLFLLALSMAGSLALEIYLHNIEVSPDNVAHLPQGDHQGLFRVTALLLTVSEAIGCAVGIWGVIKLHATRRKDASIY
ncbi:MAG: hypothetical protein ACRD36_01925 [Candidatus Acidiferrum sp.]